MDGSSRNMSSSEVSNNYHDSNHPLNDGDDVFYDARFNSDNYHDESNSYNALDNEQYRTEILKLILYDLNSTITPRESRLLAIRTALDEFDHNDQLLHEEELDLRADHILLQKLTYALSIDPRSDEVGYICSALEAVYRASRERLAESFHEISDALLPLFVEMIRPPRSSRKGRGMAFSLRHQKNNGIPLEKNGQSGFNQASNNIDESVKHSSSEIPADEIDRSNNVKNSTPLDTGEYPEGRISQGESSVNPAEISATAEASEMMSMGAIVPASYYGNRMNMNPKSTAHSAVRDYGQILALVPPETAAGERNDTIRSELEDAKKAMLNQAPEPHSSSNAEQEYGDESIAMSLRGGGIEGEDGGSELDYGFNGDREGDHNFVNDKSELSNDDSSVLQSELNDLFRESRGSVSSRLLYEDQDNPFSDTSSLYDNSTAASSFRNYGGGATSGYSESKDRESADDQGGWNASKRDDLNATNFYNTTSYMRNVGDGGDDWHGTIGRDYDDHDTISKSNKLNDEGADDRRIHYDESSDNKHDEKDYQGSTSSNREHLPCFDKYDRKGGVADSAMYLDSQPQDHNNDYRREYPNPFGRSEDRDALSHGDERDCRDNYSESSAYPTSEEHRRAPKSAQYNSEREVPSDRLRFEEGKFPLEKECSNFNSSGKIRYDEDVLQFQKPNLSMTSQHHYHNYFDPVTIEVCPVAIRKVLKILRYFSRVLSAMEPMAQQFGLLDTMLYHMMKKPLNDDQGSETAARIDAIAVVVNLACAEENKQLLVYHPGLLDVVINIANHDPMDEAREYASIVLMNLAYAEDNKVHMVHQDYLLDTLITLLSDVSPYTRRYASATLFTLACTYANTAIMAMHCNGGIIEALRKVLLNDPVDEARVNAAEALFNMARNNTDDLAEIMGNHPRLLASLSHSVLTDYSADVRAYSARALEWLSADIHYPMQCHSVLLKALVKSSQWTKTTCVAEALKAQASLSENRKTMVEHPGLLDALGTLALLEGATNEEVRTCAISAIERLSNEESVRGIMVKNESVMTALTKATFASDSNSEDILVDGIPTGLLLKAALKNLSTYI